MIVNGPADELLRLREDLAAVLRKHGWCVTESGLPKPGKRADHVMYLTGRRMPVVPKAVESVYVPFEEAA